MFERSDDYMGKITMDALDRHVIIDATIRITWNGSKYKAYCEETKTFVQFPTSIRQCGKIFLADVVKAQKTTGTIFYRAYRGSIREKFSNKIGDVIA